VAKLYNSLDGVTSESKELLILGDFNCDFLAKRASIPECKQLNALFKSLHIKHLIKKATRITPFYFKTTSWTQDRKGSWSG
jgi:hypothetical protein